VRYVRPHQPYSLASGFVAGTGRRADGVLVDLFEVGVQAGPGSSGAPVTDLHGRLVGIILAVDASQPDSKITLAVPARWVSDILRRYDPTDRVVIQPAYLGVQLSSTEDGGAKITEVFENSPAAKAGLKAEDVVTSVDGQPIQSAEDLTAVIGQQKSGAEVSIRVQRGDEERELGVTLAERPSAASEPTTDPATGYDLELITPGEYRVAPVPGRGAVDTQVLERLSKLLQQSQGQGDAPAAATELRPLGLYVQRPEADQRLDRLTDEVKSLREEVRKLSEQLAALSRKLGDSSKPMTREEAIQSLREEFLKKLDDLGRQGSGVRSRESGIKN
jgi:hypothetical protein